MDPLKIHSLTPSLRPSPDKQEIHITVTELLELYSSPLLSHPDSAVSHPLLSIRVASLPCLQGAWLTSPLWF